MNLSQGVIFKAYRSNTRNSSSPVEWAVLFNRRNRKFRSGFWIDIAVLDFQGRLLLFFSTLYHPAGESRAELQDTRGATEKPKIAEMVTFSRHDFGVRTG